MAPRATGEFFAWLALRLTALLALLLNGNAECFASCLDGSAATPPLARRWDKDREQTDQQSTALITEVVLAKAPS